MGSSRGKGATYEGEGGWLGGGWCGRGCGGCWCWRCLFGFLEAVVVKVAKVAIVIALLKVVKVITKVFPPVAVTARKGWTARAGKVGGHGRPSLRKRRFPPCTGGCGSFQCR